MPLALTAPDIGEGWYRPHALRARATCKWIAIVPCRHRREVVLSWAVYYTGAGMLSLVVAV